MTLLGSHGRTVVLVLSAPLAVGVSTVTRNIQLVFFSVGLVYLIAAGTLYRRRSGDSEHSTVTAADLVLRRGGAWVLILVILSITLLITQDFVVGAITLLAVYAGGILDQASLRPHNAVK